jgi:crossover junction endodeoxyribonuclease RusA
MILTLPFPDSRLLPNKRLHYMALYKAKKEAKLHGQVAALEEMVSYEVGTWEPIESCTIKYTWYPPDNRRRDEDNYVAAMKPYLDGIVKAGLLRDDSPQVIKHSERGFGLPDKLNPRTEVEIKVA